MTRNAFAPLDWLARFEADGGGWIVQDGRPVLLCPTGAKACDSCLAELDSSNSRHAVLALILYRHAVKELNPAE